MHSHKCLVEKEALIDCTQTIKLEYNHSLQRDRETKRKWETKPTEEYETLKLACALFSNPWSNKSKPKKTHRNQQNAKQTKAQEQEEESQEGTSSLLLTNRTFLGFEALMVYNECNLPSPRFSKNGEWTQRFCTSLQSCLSVCLSHQILWVKWIAFAQILNEQTARKKERNIGSISPARRRIFRRRQRAGGGRRNEESLRLEVAWKGQGIWIAYAAFHGDAELWFLFSFFCLSVCPSVCLRTRTTKKKKCELFVS
jgi:ferredoxin